MLNEGSLTGGPAPSGRRNGSEDDDGRAHRPCAVSGSAALVDLLSGRLQVSFVIPSGKRRPQSVKSGKLRGLAVTTAERWEGFAGRPDRRGFYTRL